MTIRAEKSWDSTLFAPPILRVTRQKYARLPHELVLRAQLPPVYVLMVVPRPRTPLATAWGPGFVEVGGGLMNGGGSSRGPTRTTSRSSGRRPPRRPLRVDQSRELEGGAVKPEQWQRHQFFELRRLLDVVNQAPSGRGVEPPPPDIPEGALMRALQTLAEEERQRLDAWERAVSEARQAADEQMRREMMDAFRRGDRRAIRRMIAEERCWEKRIAAEEREAATCAGEALEIDVWAAEDEEEDDEA